MQQFAISLRPVIVQTNTQQKTEITILFCVSVLKQTI